MSETNIIAGLIRSFKRARLMPFDREKGLPEYFGEKYIKRVEGAIDRLDTGRVNEANLVQIPLFARILKEMAVKGEVGKKETFRSRADILERYVNFVMRDQASKEKGAEVKVKEAAYETMRKFIGTLSVGLLSMGKEQNFTRDDAVEALNDDDEIWERYSPLMGKTFMRRFLGFEDEGHVHNKRYRDHYRYHHRIFQEFLAAESLYQLYRRTKKKYRVQLLEELAEIDYRSDLGEFFADMVAEISEHPESDFDYWQNILTESEGGNLLTYALQVRDRLGESDARGPLYKLFNQENATLKPEATAESMVRIPVGRFLRGSYEDSAEWPVRWIELDGYCIDRYPVTNEEFIEFLNTSFSGGKEIKDEGGNKLISIEGSRISDAGGLYHIDDEQYREHPVNNVTWYGAKAYCRWRSEREGMVYRLPTEAEWERAARGEWGRRYPWGNEFDKEKCNMSQSGKGTTTEVAHYVDKNGESPYGCYDMAGNVWEWCEDSYKGEYYKESPVINPVCTEESVFSVLRGGSWLNGSVYCRAAYRDVIIPSLRNYYTGFRCARTLKL
ncbi:MAG: SUMF1/EgtB/PvdO family nonheme iron enzyme [Thermodesulfobacteriota bacterium]